MCNRAAFKIEMCAFCGSLKMSASFLRKLREPAKAAVAAPKNSIHFDLPSPINSESSSGTTSGDEMEILSTSQDVVSADARGGGWSWKWKLALLLIASIVAGSVAFNMFKAKDESLAQKYGFIAAGSVAITGGFYLFVLRR